jgi:hypothetical protein
MRNKKSVKVKAEIKKREESI